MRFTLSEKDKLHLFEIKYGSPKTTGRGPRRRLGFGYYQPCDVYEAFIMKIVDETTVWVDIGGGRALFPYNEHLSETLAQRCQKLVAVDPSKNIHDNPYANEKHEILFEDFDTRDKFDLATFRMVAEHITNPTAVLDKLKSIIKPGGLVVIYTINRFSPIPIITRLTPFSLHYPIKKFFWGGEERDTFPVAYKMNTHSELRTLFSQNGFDEVYFEYLDDLSMLARFSIGNYIELLLWKFLRLLNVPYPENNILAIYKKN